MFRLKTGYIIGGITTGCILLFTFLWTIPDGKLHLVFCNVGQGDASYIRFPDGRDMLVDGGPNDAVLTCLGKHMPFWDRHIDIVVLTHPQKDHLQGLIPVLERYSVSYVIKSDVANDTDGYKQFIDTIRRKKIPVKYMTTGDQIAVGSTQLSFLWPSEAQIAKGSSDEAFFGDALQEASLSETFLPVAPSNTEVLGEQSFSAPQNAHPRSLPKVVGDLNDYCLVFWLRYGSFDALFTGDADSRIEPHYAGTALPDGKVELLKVPHHGSKTGMTDDFIHWLLPKLAVISVGKNSYGHPGAEALDFLRSVDAQTWRTDKSGDIEVVSDGTHWVTKTEKK